MRFSSLFNGIALFLLPLLITFMVQSLRIDDEGDEITVIGVGDMMIGTNYPNNGYLPPNDGATYFDNVKSILRNADLTFGNLEGVILTSGGTVKRCSDPSKCYAFRSPDHYLDYYKDAGFDVVSIANNHSGDFGPSGRENTMKLLREQGIEYAGLLSCPTAVFEKNDVKYGFAAFAPNSGTVDIRNIARAKEIVAGLEKEADVVIVSFHGGGEGKSRTHVPRQTETFYGENRGNVHAFAHAVIDAGADIVFGHGPHVPRAFELYKNRFIAYSLGNFATYGRFNISGISGIAPIVKVYLDEDGDFIKAQVISSKLEGEGIPKIDSTGQAFTTIRDLTEADYPDTRLDFSQVGWVYPGD